MDITKATLSEMAKKLHAKEISSVELTKMHLERIKKWQPKLNAFTVVTEDTALKQAEQADKKLAGKKAGVLTGIPCALKDVFSETGVETTACSNILRGYQPPFDATTVAKLRDEGCVFVGHTNTDEFTMGSSTQTSCFGPTRNPWDMERVAGGSSGGSAAAVSANLCGFALGTDTGGSIRQPAAFCGCSGLKVTYGRVSRSGVMSMASSLDTIGPLGKSCEDLALVMQSLAGADAKDSTTPPNKVPDYTKELTKKLKGLTIGIPEEYFIKGLEGEIEEAVRNAIKEYEKLGMKTKKISLPHSKYALPVYYIIAPSEISANMSRYDGVRFGPAVKNAKNLQEFYEENRAKGFGDEVKRRIMLGTYALSSGYYDAYYLKAQKVRTLIARDFESAFKDVDLIMAPVTPGTAFKVGENEDDPVKMYLEDIFTIPASLAGIVGLSVPCGFDKKKLPIGLQILGPQFSEDLALAAGHQYQLATDFHTHFPNLK